MILLAPHSDDEALFASFIIQRTGAHVVVVTDDSTHSAFGITAEKRREESQEAMKILGTTVEFLGIPESELSLDTIWLPDTDGIVFAPAKQGGHAHHDIVSEAARKAYGNRVIYYTTYKKDMLVPYGEMAVYGSPEETKKKKEALSCYRSQLAINYPHFEAVEGTPEYLCFKQTQ